ncbi:claudin-34 [Eptesicus fuscus]|uniref:claudin-34 n=1 Tax=Eptesicus fuscus TaxID=29078 RepID=UPI0024046B45|nr:claudin-34 [Eptesicus fuscus]XP_054576277.1 claudin-34 [Eptesicus fuscus]XP_054576278.1 claudin-34 [Eptesicus fuscus]
MAFYVHPNCQVASFILNTLGWMFSMISMGLAKWRVWYLLSSAAPSQGLASVGMWKVCTYQPNSLQSRPIACHRYTYSDTYLPLDIRIAQHLLLAASLLSFLGKVLTIMGLRRVYAGQLQKDTTCNLFFISGVLSIIAGTLIFIAVIWNYHSVINEEGIHFPPSFHIASRPDWQEIGSSVPVAILAAFLMLLSGLLTISYQLSPDNQVYPEVSQGSNCRVHSFANPR